MRAAGVDGCRGGWVCVVRNESGALSSGCYASAEALFAQQPRPGVLAIDVPIGLPERGARECDVAARALLERRRGSVFPAPLRAVLAAASWDEACAIRARSEGKRMSKQAWGIVAKIREVDAALRREPSRAGWVREVHPELSFARWNGGALASEEEGAGSRGAARAGR